MGYSGRSQLPDLTENLICLERTGSPRPTGVKKTEPRFEEYDIPSPLKDSMTSWTKNANAMSIIMMLFAAVQIIAIQLLPPREEASNSRWKTTRWFMYASIFLHLGGTVSAVTVVQMASAIPIKGRTLAMRDHDSLPYKVFTTGTIPLEYLYERRENDLLASWGLRWRWSFTAFHMMGCFIFGFLAAFVSLTLWIWSFETFRVAIGSAIIPVILFAGSTFWIVLTG